MNEIKNSNNESAVLEVSNLYKTFNEGKSNEVEVLQDINLNVGKGEFISLIGPSGCGKSTMLRLIGGLLPVTSGMLSVNGKTPSQAREDRDYGMAFQVAGLLDWRTARKNIELPLELLGWSREDRAERAKEMLDLVQLDEFGDSHPNELSGGMQQRVAIGRALSFEPLLLLMDEPFGALDEMTREHMQNELIGICEKTQSTVIFVTHSIPEAVFLSTRVVVMSARPGQIAKIVEVDLGQRDSVIRDDAKFHQKISEVRKALHENE